MPKRVTLAVLVLGLVAVTGLATPASAAAVTKTIDATVMPETICSPDGAWLFRLTGTGAGSGIETPDHITAAVDDGGTLTVALTTAPRGPNDAAVYEVITDEPLTGEAQADIDTAWPRSLAASSRSRREHVPRPR